MCVFMRGVVCAHEGKGGMWVRGGSLCARGGGGL